MKLLIPAVYLIQEQTPRKDPIRQLGEPVREIEGTIATYTGPGVKGFVFQPLDLSQQILIVPPRTKVFPDNHPLVIGALLDPEIAFNDLSGGAWLKRRLDRH